ncbi:MAG: phosphate/phosphite/phosphonate ABC transporter substrate-binding protein [Gammaproteobacteria bacterium]
MPVTRVWLCACMLLGSLLVAFPEPAPAATAAYTVAVVPALPATEIKRRWQPLLDALQRETGFVLKFRFYDDNGAFERGLERHEPDFAMIGPLQTWKLRQHYQPMLRDGAPMVGMVLVRKDSRIQTLAELGGRTVAFPSGSDMSASLLFAHELRNLKRAPRLLPQRTHVNGLRAVTLGKADAAISNSYSLKLMPQGLEEQLRIIHHTAPMPGPSFGHAHRVPADAVRALKDALLRLKSTSPALLESALMPNLTEAELERDYSIFATLLAAETANATP